MSRLEEMIRFNEAFTLDKTYEEYVTTKFPDKKMVIFSCMDTRLTHLLPAALNLKNGDAKIIKNAGATITHPFGSMMRSILVAIYELGAEEVFVIGHKGCGMSQVDTVKINATMLEAGIEQKVLDTLIYSGIDINKWFKGFDLVEDSVKECVNQIKHHPLMTKEVKVHGIIMDPETGEIEVVVNGDVC